MIAHLKGLLVSTGIDQAVIDVGGVGYAVGSFRAQPRGTRTDGRVGHGPHRDAGRRRFHPARGLCQRDGTRLVPHPDRRPGRRRARRIGDPLGARSGRAEPRDRGAGQGDGRAGERRRAKARRADRARTQGQGRRHCERPAADWRHRTGRGRLQGDAVSALASLGFKPGEASAAVSAALEELGGDASLDILVRLALRRERGSETTGQYRHDEDASRPFCDTFLLALVVAPLWSIWISAPFRFFPFLFLWTAIPGELIAAVVGLPVLLVLRRHLRPEWHWHALGGGVIVAMPIVLLAMKREPALGGLTDSHYAFMDTHHPRLSSEWAGEILKLTGMTFAIGLIGGVIFWAIAAQPWRRAGA